MRPAFPNRLAAIAAAAALLALAAASRNPCHPGRFLQGNDVSCEVVTLPPQLCPSCKLRPLASGGNFADCSSIYNLDDPDCQAQLKLYASLNACDKRRNLQVQDFSNQANRVALDYFTYSVCEECCDCVTMGSKPEEYDARAAAGTLLKVDRGNCVAHGHYDVCRVWPEVKYVKGPSESAPTNLGSLPKVCPLFKAWKFGPDGQNWYNKVEVNMPGPLRVFLTKFLSAGNCAEKSLWNQCYNLEKSQNRV